MKDKPRVLLFAAALSAALWTTASENRMVRLHNADGTSTVLCTDDVRKISFLAPDVDDKGITMHFTDGSFVTVYFCDEPSISFFTFGDGSVTLSSAGGESPVAVSFDDVTALTLGELASVCAPGDAATGIGCRILAGEVFFSGVPDGAVAEVFAVDGRAEGIYQAADGKIAVRRDCLGAGTHIVRIGAFSVKINL